MSIAINELTPELLKHHRDDYFILLQNMYTMESLSAEQALAVLAKMHTQGSHVYVAVHDDGHLVGTITVLLEQTFMRWGAVAGHIENVVVAKGYEGQGIGWSLVMHAVSEAKRNNCYKVILDCDEKLLGFYGKYGFEPKGVCMKMYL